MKRIVLFALALSVLVAMILRDRAGQGAAQKRDAHSEFVNSDVTPSLVMKLSDKPVDVAAVQAKLRHALTLPGDFVFDEEPLNAVVAEIEKQYAIQVTMNIRAFDEIGISGDAPVTSKLRNVSLKHALRTILSDLELDYSIWGETLLITASEDTERLLVTRVYPVNDLVELGISQSYCGNYQPSELDEIETVITSTIAVDSWDAVGGPASLIPCSKPNFFLVCSQTEAVHDEIAALLAEIRKQAKKDSAPAVPEGETLLKVYPLRANPADMEKVAKLLRSELGEADGHSVEVIAEDIVVRNSPAGHRKANALIEALNRSVPGFDMRGFGGGFDSGFGGGFESGGFQTQQSN